MRRLPDTHLLLWSAFEPERLSPLAITILTQPSDELYFTSASLWEIAIKFALRRLRFTIHPEFVRSGLLSAGYGELTVRSDHALVLADLPLIHKDPFDRILIAQAIGEDIQLLTADSIIARYPGPILQV